jgi:hypothetical protein
VRNNGATLTDHTDSDGLYRIQLDAQWLNQTGRAAVHKDAYEDADKNIVIAKTGPAINFEIVPSTKTEPTVAAPSDEQQPSPSSAELDKISSYTSDSYLYIPVSKTSGNKPSGVMAAFSPWYEVCVDPPVAGCKLESPDYSLRGDRRCNAWSECKITKNTPDQMCLSFRTQGHNESPFPGQAFSEGMISAKCKLAVNSNSPIVQNVEKRQAFDGRQFSPDNAELKVPLSAPGKIVYVEYKCEGDCAYLTPLRIDYDGNKATWYGMTNSGRNAVLSFSISYQ